MSQTGAIIKTIDVPVKQIKPSPFQPRLTFNLEDIRGSIQRDGILVPLTVREKEGYYELIDGERRLRLAKELGYKTMPVTVIDVDDDTARRMVWKVNTLRQEYTPKEKAYYFKKLQEEYGMSLRGIGRECDYDYHAVLAHLNVLKLPEKYQELVWDGPLSVSHIQELEPIFNQGEVRTSRIIQWLNQIIERKLTRSELREALRPELREIEERRIEAVQEVVREITPIPEEIKLETPEDLEEAAKILRRRAKELKTPKQIHQENVDKARRTFNRVSFVEAERLGINVNAYRRRLNEIEDYLEEKPLDALRDIRAIQSELKSEIREVKRALEEEELKRREVEMKKKIEEEAKRRARELEEVEKRRIEQEAMQKAQERILESPSLIQEVIEKAREEQIEGYSEIKERAKEIAEGISEPLGTALLRAEEEARIARTSEQRKLLENYLMLGSIIRSLMNGTIFDLTHEGEEQMLLWKSGTPITDTHEALRKRLRFGS